MLKKKEKKFRGSDLSVSAKLTTSFCKASDGPAVRIKRYSLIIVIIYLYILSQIYQYS